MFPILAGAVPQFVPPPSTQSCSVTLLSVVGSSDETASLVAGFSDLRGMVDAICTRSPLLLSPETEAAIQRASEAYGRPEDIDAWARRLVDDIRDLAD